MTSIHWIFLQSSILGQPPPGPPFGLPPGMQLPPGFPGLPQVSTIEPTLFNELSVKKIVSLEDNALVVSLYVYIAGINGWSWWSLWSHSTE